MPINCACITGIVTGEPRLGYTAGGRPVLDFCLVVKNRTENTVTGEAVEHTNYFGCVVYGKRAIGLAEGIKPGIKLAVSGFLQQDRWVKEGQKRSKTVVVVDELDFLSSRGPKPKKKMAPDPGPESGSAPAA